MPDNLSIARRLYDGWNERAFEEIADLAAEGSELLVVGTGEVYRGREGALEYNRNWADGFPDGRIEIDKMLAAGDTVIVEFTGRGTHTETMKTSMGDIPATGKAVTLKLCDVLEFRDGKVYRQRTYFDSGSMMAQLGLLPEQAATTQQ